MAEHEKLVIIATHGPEDPERASLAARSSSVVRA
jgi:hypothetical protein